MKTIYYGGSILTMENPADCPDAVLVENGIIKKKIFDLPEHLTVLTEFES